MEQEQEQPQSENAQRLSREDLILSYRYIQSSHPLYNV